MPIVHRVCFAAVMLAAPTVLHQAAAAEVTIEPDLLKLPTGQVFTKGGLYGGAVIGASLGTVYQLVPPTKSQTAWSVKLIYVWSSGQGDGEYPAAPVMSDAAGNLYGSTYCGGVSAPGAGNFCTNSSYGTLYRLVAPAGSQTQWSKQTIYAFQTQVQPLVKLAMDASGTLYLANEGSVLAFTPPASGSGAYTMTALPIVAGYEADHSGVVADRFGNLYGVARRIATSPAPTDIIYQLSPPVAAGGAWTSRVLVSFDASTHAGQLGLSPSGHLFGTTNPVSGACTATNCAVYELVQAKGAWSTQVIHSFAGDALGSPPSNVSNTPFAPLGFELSFAAGGAIYGAIIPSSQSTANSTIYRLSPPASGQTVWTETPLYTFQGAPNGFVAGTKMYIAGNGTVYGTAIGGKVSQSYPQSIAFKITAP